MGPQEGCKWTASGILGWVPWAKGSQGKPLRTQGDMERRSQGVPLGTSRGPDFRRAVCLRAYHKGVFPY